MIGVAIIVVVLVVAIPVGVLVSSAAAAWILGLVLRTDVESRFEGSELLELN